MTRAHVATAPFADASALATKSKRTLNSQNPQNTPIYPYKEKSAIAAVSAFSRESGSGKSASEGP
jgi:hypothetical protein